MFGQTPLAGTLACNLLSRTKNLRASTSFNPVVVLTSAPSPCVLRQHRSFPCSTPLTLRVSLSSPTFAQLADGSRAAFSRNSFLGTCLFFNFRLYFFKTTVLLASFSPHSHNASHPHPRSHLHLRLQTKPSFTLRKPNAGCRHLFPFRFTIAHSVFHNLRNSFSFYRRFIPYICNTICI